MIVAPTATHGRGGERDHPLLQAPRRPHPRVPVRSAAARPTHCRGTSTRVGLVVREPPLTRPTSLGTTAASFGKAFRAGPGPRGSARGA